MVSLQSPSGGGGHARRWAWLGFAAGSAAAVTFAVVHCSHNSERNDCRRAWSALLVPVLGGGGAIAGGVLGGTGHDNRMVRIVRVPVWVKSPLSISAVVGARTQALGLNVAF